MIVAKQSRRDGSAFWRLALLAIVPAFLVAILTWMAATSLLPADQWWRALVRTNDVIPSELLFRHAFVPRVAVSVLSGLGLGLAGALLQHLLRNPLAEPTTIGTNADAGLALTIATLYVPSLLESGREWVALAGGTASTLLVFMLARQRHFSPVAIIVSGLVVSLTCGSAGFLLMAINREYTEDLFIWQSGSLVQNGDAVARALFAQIAIVSALAFAWFIRSAFA
ncbi:iron chelate uptake ABC transporter family permease subunit [Sinorhizobium fredii]|uniref:iron chelate uptake ABC transporter family permease subunit n=1 Tax=Rhizobium fredii TaxID=380 RepID=UPI0005956468|nr:iron chelate uptake ABC transporter family permease subunit [Sinorhizobium fredii]WOS61458.1 iron chelate uptake ABC transporter family permease subunit [Sinorhizobium fredii GR64]